ncbi:hypothetical protein [Spirosoma radiotolerans]|uniref:Transmembrane protein n=1 Tax=Spirosoma radiotolerans TaxID=1379870 RepID=A0A0E3ZTA7_9BACT|nr:hypothetical protein [Spirosoma radiotolerans]AKD54839.1 hypothetical protein SD10_07885 [Spirosoma radiotolerans]
MFLVVHPLLWKWVGCFALLASAWFVFGQPVPTLAYLLVHLKRLKRFFTLPPTADRESTWPGEDDIPWDDESQTP